MMEDIEHLMTQRAQLRQERDELHAKATKLNRQIRAIQKAEYNTKAMQMIADADAGMTLRAMADKYGKSPERIRQIMMRYKHAQIRTSRAGKV